MARYRITQCRVNDEFKIVYVAQVKKWCGWRNIGSAYCLSVAERLIDKYHRHKKHTPDDVVREFLR